MHQENRHATDTHQVSLSSSLGGERSKGMPASAQALRTAYETKQEPSGGRDGQKSSL